MHNNLRSTYDLGPATREWVVTGHVYDNLAEFDILQAGITDATRGFHFEGPMHQFQAVLVCTSGRGLAWVEGEWLEFGPGKGYVIPYEMPFGYKALDASRWKLGWVTFVHTADRLPPLAVRQATLLSCNAEGLRSSILGLYQEGTSQRDPELMHCWATLMARQARRLGHPTGVAAEDNPLAGVWDAVRKALSREWTLGELCAVGQMTPEQLRRLAHQYNHQSPMQEVTRLRMDHAAGLLRRTKLKVQEVAWTVGYRNAFAFSTTFRRLKGMSPLEYRVAGNSGGRRV